MQPTPGATEMLGYRTTVREGREEAYRAVHASIPPAVAEALHRSGVVSWRIWQDGRTLFHTIETLHGRDAMIERMTALGPIDPGWDALIDSIVDDAPGSSADLAPVWAIVDGVQVAVG